MSTRQAHLTSEARRFAGDLSDLLNGAITHGIRVSAVMLPTGTAVVGYRITKNNLRSSPIGLRTRQPRTSLYLFVTYTLDLNERDPRFLTVTTSTYGLGTHETQRAFRYDYERNASNEYPYAHLHILGASERLAALVRAGRRDRDPSRLHLPVGGRRFRPCLEDIIEFCIVEPQHDMWEEKAQRSSGSVLPPPTQGRRASVSRYSPLGSRTPSLTLRVDAEVRWITRKGRKPLLPGQG